MRVGSRPQLRALRIADPPERWKELGFAVQQGDRVAVGGVCLHLGAAGRGITGWVLSGFEAEEEIDGLPTFAEPPPPPATAGSPHPNGATGLDHVVVLTPAFDRTASAFERAGMPLSRITRAPPARMGFRRLGPTILELVEAPQIEAGPARFWGLVVVVENLEALARWLPSERLGAIKPAVQTGRRIATLKDAAGITPKVAFMDPEPMAADHLR